MILLDYLRENFVPGADEDPIISRGGRHRKPDSGPDFDPMLAGVLSVCFFTGLLLGSRFRRSRG